MFYVLLYTIVMILTKDKYLSGIGSNIMNKLKWFGNSLSELISCCISGSIVAILFYDPTGSKLIRCVVLLYSLIIGLGRCL